MRDIHSHILPGVDDGAQDLGMALEMLEAARAAGVTSIVCTPHVRDPYFDYDRMWSAYRELAPRAQEAGIEPAMGFEVAHAKLLELGVRAWAERLSFEGSSEFLLELDSGCSAEDFREYERTIYKLQTLGRDVIIAHPERYRAIQKRPELAEELVRMGCRLQASANFISGGRLGREKRPARRLFERGLYRFIASDAHRPRHYELLARAVREFPVGEEVAGW